MSAAVKVAHPGQQVRSQFPVRLDVPGKIVWRTAEVLSVRNDTFTSFVHPHVDIPVDGRGTQRQALLVEEGNRPSGIIGEIPGKQREAIIKDPNSGAEDGLTAFSRRIDRTQARAQGCRFTDGLT